MKTKTPIAQKNPTWVKQTLIFSLILNALFLALFFYFFVKENPLPISFAYKPVLSPSEKILTNQKSVALFSELPFEKLTPFLQEKRHIESGVNMRDIALSMCVTRHHFDIERALGKKLEPHAFLKITAEKKLPIFALSDEEFKTVSRFATQEKWPFTFAQLFTVIKEKKGIVDPALLQMFFQSDEIATVEKIFRATAKPLQRKLLLNLVLEGNYETLKTFVESQKKQFDPSEKTRRAFLLRYLPTSQTAALVLLYTDMDFATRFLDDKSALTLLGQLPPKSPQGVVFATTLLNSPRNDEVKKRSQAYLSDDKELSQKFYNRPSEGTLRPNFRSAPPAAPAPSQHIVQPNESLFSIARKYNLSVEDLIRINHLPSTTIQSGKILLLKDKG